MADDFTINGVSYAFPAAFRLCDPVLITEVTGLSYTEFAELLDEGADPRTIAGMVAVAVWQKHPTWKREKVIKFVQEVNLDDLMFADDDVEADAAPLTVDGDTGNSPVVSTPPSAEPDLSEPILVSTGTRL